MLAYSGWFTFNTTWNSQDRHPRQLADVNGDGRADIVGFAGAGAYVALGQADGTFALAEAGYLGWYGAQNTWTSQDKTPRLVADVNGDGRADIVGFNSDGVYVSLAILNGDTLVGGDGDDTLDGGAGTDSLIGGTGNDVYIVDSADDVVVENAEEGVDEVRTALASYTLAANIENLSYTGSGNFSGTGNSGDNILTGAAGADALFGLDGADWLDGGAGGDTLTGGTGNDTYVVDNVNDEVVELTGQGVDTVRTSLNAYTLGDNVENLVFTGSGDFSGVGNAANNNLTGGGGADMLTGLDGNDTLNGGGGADTMIGGAGDDVYYVNSGGDVVVENSGEGIDTVNSSISYALGANVEKLALTGSSTINGTGNDLDNVLTGNGGANTLDGGAGDDTLKGGGAADILIGGDGFDTAVYSGRAFDVSFTATADGWIMTDPAHGAGVDVLIGIEQAQFDDRIIYLDGRNNAPLIDQALTASTNEDAGALFQNLLAGSSDFEGQALSVVNFAQINGPVAVVSRNGADFQLDPTQFGGLAAGEIATLTFSYDVSDGIATTAQTLTVTVEGRNDAPILTNALAAETDENAAALSINLLQGATDIDNGATLSVMNFLQISGPAAAATRNGADFQLDPTQFGGLAAGETATLTFSYDVFDGQDGTAQTLTVTVTGYDEPLQLIGGVGDDALTGGGDNDTLIGGAGADTLTGGAGSDIFFFRSPDEGQDVITDFQFDVDRIEVLAAEFDNLPIGQLSADRFSSDGVVSADTRFIFDPNTGVLSYDADGSGAGAAVGLATLNTSTFNYTGVFVAS